MVGIYKIQNKINGKVYIGQSIDIDKRIKEHFYKAENKKDISYNSAIHHAIRKYGKENFECSVIEECNQSELDDKERGYIKQYNSLSPNGYNISSGGQKCKKKEIEDNERMVCIFCGKEIDKYSILGLCRDCYKKYMCSRIPKEEALREKLFELNGNFTDAGNFYGVSDNAVKKWCKKYGMPYHSKDYKSDNYIHKNNNSKSVGVFDQDGNMITIFVSLTEASRYYSKIWCTKPEYVTSGIWKAINNRRKTYHGLIWKYIT